MFANSRIFVHHYDFDVDVPTSFFEIFKFNIIERVLTLTLDLNRVDKTNSYMIL